MFRPQPFPKFFLGKLETVRKPYLRLILNKNAKIRFPVRCKVYAEKDLLHKSLFQTLHLVWKSLKTHWAFVRISYARQM